MRPIKWTKKRRDQLRLAIYEAARSMACSDDGADRLAEIADFEAFMNSKGLAAGYEIQALTK